MPSVIHTWFTDEVYFWRNVASSLWAVICLPFFFFVLLLLSKFSLTHPVDWLYGTVTYLISEKFWINIVVLEACLGMVIWSSLPHFTVIPEIDRTQLASWLGLFRWSRQPLLIICSLAGALTAWAVSRLNEDEFGSWTYVLSTDTHEYMVLNEKHMFLVLSGIFAGLSYYCQFFRHRQYYLVFPNLQRFRWFQVRSEIAPTFRACMRESLSTIKYYYLIYFLFGSLPKAWIVSSFNMTIHPESTPLNSVMGMLNVTLFWQTYLCALMLRFSWSYSRMLIRIYHTARYEFTIQSDIENKEKSLPEALACSSSSLLQHLAFLDFSFVSKFSADRRQQLLSLSQPGGHPRIWSSASTAAVVVVRELIDRVKEENWAIMTKVHVNSQKSTSHSGDAVFTTKRDTRSSDKVQEEERVILNFLKKLASLVSGLPVICHQVAESPDAKSRRLFASCQLQIWALEALSHMAARSYTEDKYGIVQPALSTIFELFLDLHEAVDKHFKLSSSVFRRSAGSFFSDALLRYKLHSVNKASIYRVVDRYRNHLEDLRLSPDYLKKLQPFVDYNV